MRIHLLSDLHLEYAKMDPSYVPPECDVVVLAGDISPGLPGLLWAQDTFDAPVIYVLGNHEFYGMRGYDSYIQKLKAHSRRSDRPQNVTILDDEEIVINGVRFLGSTLWADLRLYGNEMFTKEVVSHGIADYRFIHYDDEKRLTVQNTQQMHWNAYRYLVDKLREPFEGKTVVVTHHGPSAKSIAPQWEHHPLSPSYASNLEWLMKSGSTNTAPQLWLHGHVHDNFDYVVHDTRVVVNPRGYKGPKSHENNFAFDPQLVITI